MTSWLPGGAAQALAADGYLIGCRVDAIAAVVRPLGSQYQLKLASARLVGGVPGVLALSRARPTLPAAASGPCPGQECSGRTREENGNRPTLGRRRRLRARS